MNRSLIWLPALFLTGIAVYQPVKEASTSKIEDKSVSFVIYKAADYNSPIYNNSTAQVHILVEKVSTRGHRTAVWDKTLSTELVGRYPSLKNAITQNIRIANVNKKREHLEVTYTLLYNSTGTELQMQGDEVLTETSNKVNIKI